MTPYKFFLIYFILTFGVFANSAGTFIKGPALVEGFTTITSAAGTTTLTVASETKQIVTGSTTQTIQLPAATTLPLGRRFYIINKSSGTVTVNDGGAGLLTTIDAASQKEFHLRVAGSAAGTWDTLSGGGLSGVVPIANGGTNNSTAYTSSGIVFSDGTKLTENANYLNWDNANQRFVVGVDAADNTFTLNGSTKGSTFTVNSQGGANEYEQAFHRHSATLNSASYFLRSRGSQGAPSIVSSGDIVGGLNFIAYDGVDYEFTAKIESTVDGTPGSNDMPGALSFYTTPDGATTPARALKIANDKTLTMDAYGSGYLKSSSAGVISSATFAITSDLTMTATDTLAISTTEPLRQTFLVQGNSAAITMSTTPFGATPPPDGSVIYIIGNDDANTVTVPQNDAADGCLMDGDVTLAKGQTLGLMYSSTLDRYVRIK